MAAASDNAEIIQYAPFVSFVHPSFWNKLKDLKLEVDKLCETKKQVFGRFIYRDTIGTVFEVDGTSFNQIPETGQQCCLTVEGTIMNKNTLEEFKSIDKAVLLNVIGQTLWANVEDMTWIKKPGSLLSFIILSFADLKKFNYYYWFAFPAPSQPTLYTKDPKQITNELSNKQIEDLNEGFQSLDYSQKYFFIAAKENDNITLKTLEDFMKIEISQNDLEQIYFVFTDPSSGDNPGWPLRLFMAALLKACPNLSNSELKVIALRVDKTGGIASSSRTFTVVTKNIQPVESAGWVGWERNEKGNFGPRLANMSASMDTRIMASDQADLNIKLMKWRLVPELDVTVMGKTSCLLLGAGTLGSQVARGLLAWGFRTITFIDNGKVSFSNPTRQCLYNFMDACHSKMKAEAAAAAVQQVLPAVTSKGIVAHIPMPGHPVGESLKAEMISSIETITEAIQQHEVIFLLLDTREARWLPTLLGAHFGKIVINAALGFDSYLVMRHGLNKTPPQGGTSIHSTYIPGSELGCYFCNDVTAPGDSMKDRTLDQQCTVTRPGVSAIAGALAVELLVAMLQHPLKAQAPALYNFNDEDNQPTDLQGVLGPVPHSIRGFLHNYQNVAPTSRKFEQCIACSDVVVKQYREEGIEFLLKVFNSGKYLEELTGLSELHLAAEVTDLMALSDDEED